jgi:hypothetical protein
VESSIWHHCSHGHIQLGRVFPSLLQFGLFPKKQQTLLSMPLQ